MTALSQLTERELLLAKTQAESQFKSGFLAFVLWLFFGVIGAHCFYLNRPVQGWLFLSPLIVAGFLILAGGNADPNMRNTGLMVLFTWYVFAQISSIVTAFSIPHWRREANANILDAHAQTILSSRPSDPLPTP